MGERTFCYEFPRPAVTTDVVMLRPSTREVILVRRKKEPFEGKWALPGGFVDQDEDLPVAAKRELAEETGIEAASLRQFRAYGTPGRDPRGDTVSIVFLGREEGQEPVAGDDAAEARWWSIDALPELAFDHTQIMNEAMELAIEIGWLGKETE